MGDRLRGYRNERVKGPLPSPGKRHSELPEGMNPYTIARRSMDAPLRSCYFDDAVNNQPKQKTQSAMFEARRRVNEPHASYDIDGDGFISQSDYHLAKRFDADGNGVIDKEEMDAGKRLIAKELWEKYRAQHFLQKPPITDIERQTHVDALVKLKDEH